MPKGGIRPRTDDGSLDHLLKPKWHSGTTKTIRVPIALADQLIQIAHQLDDSDQDGQEDLRLAYDRVDWLNQEINDALDRERLKAVEAEEFRRSLNLLEEENKQLHIRNGDLALELVNCKEQMEWQQTVRPDAAIALLEESLNLPANKGGAIKAEIKKAIALLTKEEP